MNEMGTPNTHARVSWRVKTVYWMLKLTYALFMFVIGFDKFFYFLTKWSRYTNISVAQAAHLPSIYFMYLLGVLEIIGGCLILRYTHVGSYAVAVWFLLLAVNLASLGRFYDAAVTDVVLAMGALCLALMTAEMERKHAL